MPVTHLSGRSAQLDISLDGVTFTRSESDAARRAIPRRIHVDWDTVTGAEVQSTRKGRAVIRVGVRDVRAPARHQEDPHALKVRRAQTSDVQQVVEQINDEVAARRRWRQHAEH